MPTADEALIKSVKPYDSKSEKAVLGAIVIDNRRMDELQDLLPDGSYFYNASYGKIYDAMKALHRQGLAIDKISIQSKLREMDVPPEMVSDEFLRNAIVGTTSANIMTYATAVSEAALKRELISVTESIANACYESKEPTAELFDRTEKEVYQVIQRRSVRELKSVGDIVMETLKNIDRAAKAGGEVTGLASGFRDLDKKTAGFQPGNLVLVAARPAMGKTSFVLSMVKNVAILHHKPVLMFSLEMSTTELMNRLLSMTAHIDAQKFKTGQMSGSEWHEVVSSGGDIAQAPLFLEDRSTTLGEIRSISRKYKIEHDICMIVIDYLQLMNSSGKRSDSRQQEISDISRGLKLLAKELQIPIIALSQLSRAVEGRTDRHPQLSDLRESGAIEQDADTVIFIYREEVYKPDTDKKGIAEIMIQKQRSGPTGTVEMKWVASQTMFHDLAK